MIRLLLRCRITILALGLALVGLGWAQENLSELDQSQGAISAEQTYAPFPGPDAGYVTDLAGLLTKEEEERIESWLWQTESRTDVEIAVVTIERMSLYPDTPSSNIQFFAKGLFDAWGIGNLPDNNGVLLLVSSRDRKARIELGAAYGTSRNADARRIMDEIMMPRFRQEQYAEGITAGVKAILLEFADISVGIRWDIIILSIASIAGIAIAVSLFRSGKQGWAWVAVAAVIAMLVFLFSSVRSTLEHLPTGDSDSWGSGGLGGGFGGGSSGDGGATGDWGGGDDGDF